MKQLEECGQSVWLDYLKRSIIGGDLRELIERDGLKGVTSNPSIFEKAIGETDEYADALKQWLAQGDHGIAEIYEYLAIGDIRAAAQLLRPVYDRTQARDGYISLECSPYLANDTKATVAEALRPNWLVLSIAPEEGISLQFEVKRPGPVVDLAAVRMDFHYGDWFPREPNVGYETLLYDVMVGDQTLFMRADKVEQAWRIVQPVLDAWAAETAEFPDYESRSDGPKSADELLRHGARAWRPLTERRA